MLKEKTIILLAVLLIPAAAARGERRFTLGNQYVFAFGGTNQGSFTSTQLQTGLAPFLGFYPSIELRSAGRDTDFGLFYLGSAERFDGDQRLDSLAHMAGGDLAVRAGRRLTLALNASFSSAPDYTSTDVLRGTPVVNTFRFVFQPSTIKSIRQSAGGAFGVKLDLNYRSYVTLDLSSQWLNYSRTAGDVFPLAPAGQTSGGRVPPGTPNPHLNQGLAFLDQSRQEGRLGYWYRLSPHETVDVQYVFIRNDYKEFGVGRTQEALIGYTRQFSPYLGVHLEMGPAYVAFDTTRFYGYMASATVTRKIRSSQVSGFYSHLPGDSSGLGSLSNLHSAGIAVFTPLWNQFSIGSSFAGFFSRGALDNAGDYRGFYGSFDLSHPLSSRWFITLGGSFRQNDYGIPSNQGLGRIYLSLRFRAPELWRTSL